MADFCAQCNQEMFGMESDFAGAVQSGQLFNVICEGCGSCIVDHKGICVSDCLQHHGTIIHDPEDLSPHIGQDEEKS